MARSQDDAIDTSGRWYNRLLSMAVGTLIGIIVGTLAIYPTVNDLKSDVRVLQTEIAALKVVVDKIENKLDQKLSQLTSERTRRGDVH